MQSYTSSLLFRLMITTLQHTCVVYNRSIYDIILSPLQYIICTCYLLVTYNRCKSGERALSVAAITAWYKKGKGFPTSGPLEKVLGGLWENSDVIPLKSTSSWGDLDCHLIHRSLGPPKSTSETASWSVQPFLQGSQSLQIGQTNRQTDHATRVVKTAGFFWPVNRS